MFSATYHSSLFEHKDATFAPINTMFPKMDEQIAKLSAMHNNNAAVGLISVYKEYYTVLKYVVLEDVPNNSLESLSKAYDHTGRTFSMFHDKDADGNSVVYAITLLLQPSYIAAVGVIDITWAVADYACGLEQSKKRP
ncbi:hypothetical protein BGW39_003370 [Mortierella sp. 14UC]|nr:hypothetical protein BGW39_003370 [Mortierella sp. 14UC]